MGHTLGFIDNKWVYLTIVQHKQLTMTNHVMMAETTFNRKWKKLEEHFQHSVEHQRAFTVDTKD